MAKKLKHVGPSFLMHCLAEVSYDGRASSTLERGWYVVVCKKDGSILIHGGSLAKPLNYQGPGTVVDVVSDEALIRCRSELDFPEPPKLLVTAKNKKEVISVAAYEIALMYEVGQWDDHKIKLVRSEKELQARLVEGYADYLPGVEAVFIESEASTPYGPVDLLIVDQVGVRHVIEIKRKIASLAACSQVGRYAKHFESAGFIVRQYIAAPALSKGAATYCSDHGIEWIKIGFD